MDKGQPGGEPEPRQASEPARDRVQLAGREALYQFLDELARATENAADANEILSITTRMTATHLSLSNCAYADMDEDQDGFTIRGNWHAPGSPSIVGRYRLADFGKLAVQELGSGRPLIINDNSSEIAPEEAKTFQDIGIAATICMPFLKSGRLVALMAIHDRAPHHWSDYELAVIKKVTERSWSHVERLRSDIALRTSNARFEAAVRATQDVLWTNDASGRMIGKQPGWEALTGQPIDEYQGHGWSSAVHPDDAQPTLAAWLRAVEARDMFVFEHRLRRADGRWGIFSVRAVPILDDQGEVTEWVGVHTDITAQRESEAALREETQSLEERVIERTRELEQANEALRQAQKMEAIGQLTGGIAHDFNNLLTVIRGSADLLKRPGIAEEKRQKYLNAISDTADRAANLTGQLLSFARKQALKPEIFNVAARIEHISQMLRSLLGSRISLLVKSHCEDCFVEADISQFETALVNLASNAKDALGGEGEITLGTGRDKDERGRDVITVSVSDVGEGIPRDRLDRIFEPFFTTKAAGKGTGLGLSQVYGFAKQSRGEVKVVSQLGQGTTVAISLPLVAPAKSPAPVDSNPGSADLRNKLVLVVEDNDEVREFARSLLEESGFSTLVAPTATVALDILKADAQRIDVVFTDVVMPEMNGIEFGGLVRKQWPSIPVILTSGYSEIIVEEGRHGFQLLQKPYSANQLRSAIGAALAT